MLLSLAFAGAAAFTPPTTSLPSAVASRLRVRSAVPVMGTAEDKARKKWLERQGKGDDAADSRGRGVSKEEAFAMQKAARERILKSMDGDPDKQAQARMGSAAAFGLGVDDTDYGYGREVGREELEQRLDDEGFERSPWGDDRRAGEIGQPAEGFFSSGDGGLLSGGFDGRSQDWRRKDELVDPSPPRMSNTLTAPAANATAVQSFTFDIESARDTVRKMGDAELEEQEEELLAALTGAEPTTNRTAGRPKGSFDNTDFWHSGWDRGAERGPTR